MHAEGSSPVTMRYAEPTALGLFGLAIGVAALLPIAFGSKEALTADGLRTAAWFCFLFGAGGQLIAGLMSFANKNMLGGTLFTTFSFNWVMNGWSLAGLAEGRVPNSAIVFAVDVCFLVIFVVMTYAFGFFSRVLFLFLLDIDALYVCRILKEVTHSAAFALPIGIASALLCAIALYIAFALVLVSASGKALLPMGGPMFSVAGASAET